EVLPPAAPPPRGRPLYLPGRHRHRHDNAAGSDLDGDKIGVAAMSGKCEAAPGVADLQGKPSVDVKKSPPGVAVKRGSGGGASPVPGQVHGGVDDVARAAGAAAGANGWSCGVIGMEAMETVVCERPLEGPQDVPMGDTDEAYFQAIYDAEMAAQANTVETAEAEAEVAEGGIEEEEEEEGEQQEKDGEEALGLEEQEHEEEVEEEEEGNVDDEDYIGVFRSMDEHRPLQRHLYGLLAAVPSGAANGSGGGGGPAAAANGVGAAGVTAERGGGACGGALSTAGCSQVIPSFAFSRRLTAPRLYWGAQYQAQVPPPPPFGSAAAAAAQRRRPPSAAALARM
ncbi:hypothetical protein Vafri_20427, partial [Volvox africanus]